jgi:glycosyltransferase involved in cell wall biosynthesis
VVKSLCAHSRGERLLADMAADLIPVSVVIPTRNRPAVLRRNLMSLAEQSVQPARIVVVDASESSDTRIFCVERPIPDLHAQVLWLAVEAPGAAGQRNRGIQECQHPVIGFFDDDILFEPNCIARLWSALRSDPKLGGVSAMITNQRYHAPGRASRLMFRLLAGRFEKSYAGRVLGPAVHLLPEDREDLPDVVPVDWLNLGCTLYRREALPEPPFPSHFVGASMMEDVALSLTVGKLWKLANARTARIYHDSQPGEHKANPAVLSRMEVVNRHYVMTEVMERRRVQDYGKLAFWQICQLLICAIENHADLNFWHMLYGKLLGVYDIVLARGRGG